MFVIRVWDSPAREETGILTRFAKSSAQLPGWNVPASFGVSFGGTTNPVRLIRVSPRYWPDFVSWGSRSMSDIVELHRNRIGPADINQDGDSMLGDAPQVHGGTQLHPKCTGSPASRVPKPKFPCPPLHTPGVAVRGCSPRFRTARRSGPSPQTQQQRAVRRHESPPPPPAPPPPPPPPHPTPPPHPIPPPVTPTCRDRPPATCRGRPGWGCFPRQAPRAAYTAGTRAAGSAAAQST